VNQTNRPPSRDQPADLSDKLPVTGCGNGRVSRKPLGHTRLEVLVGKP